MFSGTLSYIFNKFSDGKNRDGPSFSSIVSIAQQEGYTVSVVCRMPTLPEWTSRTKIRISNLRAVCKYLQEPNPADDLNGADVARKLTILSRFIPSLREKLPDGYKSVSVKSLVPSALEGVISGHEFIERLPEHDQEFEKLRSDAFAEGKALRFVGVIDIAAGTIKADLER